VTPRKTPAVANFATPQNFSLPRHNTAAFSRRQHITNHDSCDHRIFLEFSIWAAPPRKRESDFLIFMIFTAFATTDLAFWMTLWQSDFLFYL
jgi:hypothetical protein